MRTVAVAKKADLAFLPGLPQRIGGLGFGAWCNPETSLLLRLPREKEAPGVAQGHLERLEWVLLRRGLLVVPHKVMAPLASLMLVGEEK